MRRKHSADDPVTLSAVLYKVGLAQCPECLYRRTVSTCLCPRIRCVQLAMAKFKHNKYAGNQAKRKLTGRQLTPGRTSNLVKARKAARVSFVSGSTDSHGYGFRAATSAAVQSLAHRAPLVFLRDAAAGGGAAESCSATESSDAARTSVTVVAPESAGVAADAPRAPAVAALEPPDAAAVVAGT